MTELRTDLPDQASAEPTLENATNRIGDRWPVLAALMLATLTVMLDNSVLNVALPTIGRDLHTGTGGLQWIVTAYSLTFGGLLLTTGNLADRTGRRRVLVGGLAAMATASALVLLAHTAVELTVVRALVGIGAAMVMPSTLSLLYTTFAGPLRAKAMGMWSSVTMLGFVLGPVIGGVMLQSLSWRWLFLINIPVAVVAIPVVLRTVPESVERTAEPADLTGAALSIAAMGALIYALTAGPLDGWLSGRVLGALAGTAALFGLFAGWELRAAHPMLDLRLVGRRAFAVPALVECAAFFALASTLFLNTQLMQLVLGYSALQTGLLTLPVVVVMIAMNGPLTAFATRVGPRVATVAGMLACATGMGTMAFFVHHVVGLIVSMSLMSVGLRLGMTTVALLVIDALPAERAGTGSALNDTFQEVGGALGVGVLGALLSQGYRGALPDDVTGAARRTVNDALATSDPTVVHAALNAFADGAQLALWAGAGVAGVVAVSVAVLFPRGVQVPADPDEG